MRAVVIGGSGQIGGWLLWWLAERGHEGVGTYNSVAMPGLVHLDAADRAGSAAWIKAQKPDVIFYPAGFTWVDGCERDPQRALAANLEQPLNLARVGAELGARFVYFSTDYVFDGRAGPYTEADPIGPLCVYGQSKLDAEHALARELGDAQLTARTSWVFGPERQGKNFAYQLARALREGQTVPCPSDQVSSPSYGPDVARAAVLLAEARCAGLIHVAGPEVLDRVRFAQALAKGFGLDPTGIVARTTQELAQQAPRPLRGGLLTPRLDQWSRGLMRPLSACLLDFLERLSGSEGWSNPIAG
ncbi:MAG TPA: SDR family oxidoreductase [Isosphaeraceae bacterium]|nr:SDR family oxidoreductase [Isosphaeraceae bacterium]